MKARNLLIAAAAAVTLAASVASAPATADDIDRVTPSQPAAWTGGPFGTSAPTPGGVCPAGPADPSCDHHVIEVAPTNDAQTLRIDIEWDDSTDLDVVLFDSDGAEVARATSSDPGETLVLPAEAGTYTVSVSAWFNVGAPAGRFDGTAQILDVETPHRPFDDEGLVDCQFGVPDPPAPLGALELNVLTLVDDLTLERAEQVLAGTRPTFDDIDVAVHHTIDMTFQVTSTGRGPDLEGNQRDRVDEDTLFYRAVQHVGGRVPDGYDAVMVMTGKDLLTSAGFPGLAGVASCIGALGMPERAFALAEGWQDRASSLAGVLHTDTYSSRLWSHELGHLLNLHHHYGECTAGAGRVDAGPEQSSGSNCTLMLYSPVGGSVSSHLMSHVNRQVARAHIAANT